MEIFLCSLYAQCSQMCSATWFLVISLSTLHLEAKKLIPDTVPLLPCLLIRWTIFVQIMYPWGDLYLVAEKGHSILPISAFPILTFPIWPFPIWTFPILIWYALLLQNLITRVRSLFTSPFLLLLSTTEIWETKAKKNAEIHTISHSFWGDNDPICPQTSS